MTRSSSLYFWLLEKKVECRPRCTASDVTPTISQRSLVTSLPESTPIEAVMVPRPGAALSAAPAAAAVEEGDARPGVPVAPGAQVAARFDDRQVPAVLLGQPLLELVAIAEMVDQLRLERPRPDERPLIDERGDLVVGQVARL